MSRIIDGIPEPGRHITNITTQQIIERHTIEKGNEKIDVNAIANAVINAINQKISTNNIQINPKNKEDDFDNTNTMKKLADAMIDIKSNENNMENLGTIEKTKSDGKTDKTIDLLSKLED